MWDLKRGHQQGQEKTRSDAKGATFQSFSGFPLFYARSISQLDTTRTLKTLARNAGRARRCLIPRLRLTWIG